MPLYDYRCVACGREVEVMHGIHEHGPAACEACGGARNKLLSSPAIHFKGSGWAKKDAAASAKKATSKAASSAASKPDATTGESSKKPASAASETKTSGSEGSASSSSTKTS
jgi:putative FmdB family regulatory protein